MSAALEEAVSTFPTAPQELFLARERVAQNMVASLAKGKMKRFTCACEAFTEDPKQTKEFENMLAALETLQGTQPSLKDKDCMCAHDNRL